LTERPSRNRPDLKPNPSEIFIRAAASSRCPPSKTKGFRFLHPLHLHIMASPFDQTF
jgi:hypothetical protein